MSTSKNRSYLALTRYRHTGNQINSCLHCCRGNLLHLIRFYFCQGLHSPGTTASPCGPKMRINIEQLLMEEAILSQFGEKMFNIQSISFFFLVVDENLF